MAQFAGTLTSAGQEATQAAIQQQARKDSQLSQEAFLAYQTEVSGHLWTGDDAVYKKSGLAATQAVDATAAKLKAAYAKQWERMPNNRTRRAFRGAAAPDLLGHLESLEKFRLQEDNRHQDSLTASNMEKLQVTVSNDPTLVPVARETAAGLARAAAARHGIDADGAARKAQYELSAAAIGGRIGAGDLEGAANLYAEFKRDGSLNADQIESIGKMLVAASKQRDAAVREELKSNGIAELLQALRKEETLSLLGRQRLYDKVNRLVEHHAFTLEEKAEWDTRIDNAIAEYDKGMAALATARGNAALDNINLALAMRRLPNGTPLTVEWIDTIVQGINELRNRGDITHQNANATEETVRHLLTKRDELEATRIFPMAENKMWKHSEDRMEQAFKMGTLETLKVNEATLRGEGPHKGKWATSDGQHVFKTEEEAIKYNAAERTRVWDLTMNPDLPVNAARREAELWIRNHPDATQEEFDKFLDGDPRIVTQEGLMRKVVSRNVTHTILKPAMVNARAAAKQSAVEYKASARSAMETAEDRARLRHIEPAYSRQMAKDAAALRQAAREEGEPEKPENMTKWLLTPVPEE